MSAHTGQLVGAHISRNPANRSPVTFVLAYCAIISCASTQLQYLLAAAAQVSTAVHAEPCCTEYIHALRSRLLGKSTIYTQYNWCGMQRILHTAMPDIPI